MIHIINNIIVQLIIIIIIIVIIIISIITMFITTLNALGSESKVTVTDFASTFLLFALYVVVLLSSFVFHAMFSF